MPEIVLLNSEEKKMFGDFVRFIYCLLSKRIRIAAVKDKDKRKDFETSFFFASSRIQVKWSLYTAILKQNFF